MNPVACQNSAWHDAAGIEHPWISASINGVWDSVETIGFARNIIPAE